MQQFRDACRTLVFALFVRAVAPFAAAVYEGPQHGVPPMSCRFRVGEPPRPDVRRAQLPVLLHAFFCVICSLISGEVTGLRQSQVDVP